MRAGKIRLQQLQSWRVLASNETPPTAAMRPSSSQSAPWMRSFRTRLVSDLPPAYPAEDRGLRLPAAAASGIVHIDNKAVHRPSCLFALNE